MTLAEYLVGLATIVTGVALTDLIQRTGALIEHRREIRWDWLPLLFASVATLTLVVAWGVGWEEIRRDPRDITLGRFLLGLADYVLLYLMCAATLPREPQPGIDLRDFFEKQARPYWILFGIILTYFGIHEVYVPALHETCQPRWCRHRFPVNRDRHILDACTPSCLARLGRIHTARSARN